MKKLVVSLFLNAIAAGACAQGQIQLANVENTSNDPSATANGLFWLSVAGTPVLINQDFNAAFYGGTDASSLSPIATFLLSNGSSLHDSLGPGIFLDPSLKGYPISGTIISAFFQIQAWTGNFNSYAAAVSGGASAAQSQVFVNALSLPPGEPPTFTGMPAMVLGVPEPSTFVLAGLSGLCFLLLSRRRK